MTAASPSLENNQHHANPIIGGNLSSLASEATISTTIGVRQSLTSQQSENIAAQTIVGYWNNHPKCQKRCLYAIKTLLTSAVGFYAGTKAYNHIAIQWLPKFLPPPAAWLKETIKTVDEVGPFIAFTIALANHFGFFKYAGLKIGDGLAAISLCCCARRVANHQLTDPAQPNHNAETEILLPANSKQIHK